MKIAIQKGLESYKEVLESRGHKVFYIGESDNADAVIYNETDTHPYYDVNNIPSVTAATSSGNVAYGVLLVNVSNKNEDEVLRILEKRIYSPLF